MNPGCLLHSTFYHASLSPCPLSAKDYPSPCPVHVFTLVIRVRFALREYLSSPAEAQDEILRKHPRIIPSLTILLHALAQLSRIKFIPCLIMFCVLDGVPCWLALVLKLSPRLELEVVCGVEARHSNHHKDGRYHFFPKGDNPSGCLEAQSQSPSLPAGDIFFFTSRKCVKLGMSESPLEKCGVNEIRNTDWYYCRGDSHFKAERKIYGTKDQVGF